VKNFLVILLIFLSSAQGTALAGFINPLETTLEITYKEQPKSFLKRQITDYSVWEWLYLGQNSLIASISQTKNTYFRHFFMADSIDMVKLTLEAGVFTGSKKSSIEQKAGDLLQWLPPSSELINYW